MRRVCFLDGDLCFPGEIFRPASKVDPMSRPILTFFKLHFLKSETYFSIALLCNQNIAFENYSGILSLPAWNIGQCWEANRAPKLVIEAWEAVFVELRHCLSSISHALIPNAINPRGFGGQSPPLKSGKLPYLKDQFERYNVSGVL